jgi:hypothetical protein
MFVSQGDASVLLRIGAIRNYVGAACQCVDGFEAVDSEKRHDTLRDNMFSRNKKTALVTGASSGMGKAIAKRLVEDGYQVYAAARHVERMDDLAQLGARPVRMDISSEAEVATAIDTILAYARLTQGVAKSIRNAYTPGRGTDPNVIARIVSKAVHARKPATRYVAGAYARPMILMRKWMGDRVIMSQMR